MTPDFKLAGLSLWVDGRQFENAEDYWDGNWLNIRAEVEAHHARVKAQGSFLRIDEFQGFRDELATLYRELKGVAKLEPLEPDLSIEVTAQARGVIVAEIRLTPDHLTQSHRFEFEIDQSYLPAVIREIDQLLDKFPVRGSDQ
jgi:hypothetical protein